MYVDDGVDGVDDDGDGVDDDVDDNNVDDDNGFSAVTTSHDKQIA